MASSQFSIRIPPELDEKVKEYAVVNHTTKSRVMIDALTYYLGNIEAVQDHDFSEAAHINYVWPLFQRRCRRRFEILTISLVRA